jgi:hypothetical protein
MEGEGQKRAWASSATGDESVVTLKASHAHAAGSVASAATSLRESRDSSIRAKRLHVGLQSATVPLGPGTS